MKGKRTRRNPTSFAAILLKTDLYQDGQVFTLDQATDAVGCARGSMIQAVNNLTGGSELDKVGVNLYRRPPGAHWIHKVRLANPVEDPRRLASGY